jgi:hypothetical protein
MKNVFSIILLFMMIYSTGKSQSNEKAFADTTLWHMFSYFVWVDGPGGNPHYGYFNNYEMIFSDTIINDTLFQKFSASDSNFSLNDLSLKGYFLKKNDKIYFGESIDSLELMYDYSLNIGDTFEFKSFNNPWDPTVYSVEIVSKDSVLINNNYRKRIQFESFPYEGIFENIYPSWVEGIGDENYGVVFDYGLILFCAPIGDSYIQCFNENGVSLIGNCQLSMSVSKYENDLNITAYPNPFTNSLNLSGLKGHLSKIELFRFDGQLIWQQEISSNTKIDFGYLKSEIYLLIVRCDNKVVVKKIIKTGTNNGS